MKHSPVPSVPGEKWLDEIESIFKTAKPMMDFINSVIDDYE